MKTPSKLLQRLLGPFTGQVFYPSAAKQLPAIIAAFTAGLQIRGDARYGNRALVGQYTNDGRDYSAIVNFRRGYKHGEQEVDKTVDQPGGGQPPAAGAGTGEAAGPAAPEGEAGGRGEGEGGAAAASPEAGSAS